jgi:hypothetical protein
MLIFKLPRGCTSTSAVKGRNICRGKLGIEPVTILDLYSCHCARSRIELHVDS